MLTKPPRLLQLMLSTPSARGEDGTVEMLRIRAEYDRAIGEETLKLRREFAEFTKSSLDKLGGFDVQSREQAREEIDESVVIPRPEIITSPSQCDDVIWQVSHAMAQVGRMWNVAYSAHTRLAQRLGTVEAYLRTKVIEDTGAQVEARIEVLLANERAMLREMETHAKNCERTHKRMEAMLPALRDLADRTFQKVMFRQNYEQVQVEGDSE